MMIWNSMNFNFPSSNSMELIYMLMDYTLMLLIFVMMFVTLMVMFILMGKDLNNSILVHHELEMIWSLIPFMILMFLCIPTLMSLYSLESSDFSGMSIKIMGYQWYWTYKYDFLKEWKMTSYMISDMFNLRLMESDNSILVPLNIPVNMLISSNDVIHSWTIPSAGIKMDAVPGRINQISVSMKKLGKFFGQCSEICGANHSFMPISMEVIKGDNFLKLMK